MGLSPADGSPFESVLFRAILIAYSHLYLKLVHSRSMPHSDRSCSRLRYVMRPIYGLLDLARTTNPGVRPAKSLNCITILEAQVWSRGSAPSGCTS